MGLTRYFIVYPPAHIASLVMACLGSMDRTGQFAIVTNWLRPPPLVIVTNGLRSTPSLSGGEIEQIAELFVFTCSGS